MYILTNNEVKVLKVFINASLKGCGSFGNDNLSYVTIPEVADALAISVDTATSVVRSLEAKYLVDDTTEKSAENSTTDWIACPYTCAKYPQVATLVDTDFE